LPTTPGPRIEFGFQPVARAEALVKSFSIIEIAVGRYERP
jgi:hypothetical protein